MGEHDNGAAPFEDTRAKHAIENRLHIGIVCRDVELRAALTFTRLGRKPFEPAQLALDVKQAMPSKDVGDGRGGRHMVNALRPKLFGNLSASPQGVRDPGR